MVTQVRIYPTPEKAALLKRQFGAVRFVDNEGLKEADSVTLQQACLTLRPGVQAFFDPKRPAHYPRFKRKHGKQASYHCVGVKVEPDWIKVPKLGPIRARVHRQVEGNLIRFTLTRPWLFTSLILQCDA